MNYHYHRKYNPDDVLVYIEEFIKEAGTVLFDFLDSDEYERFSSYGEKNNSQDSGSMVIVNNYRLKTIQENTVYAIKRSVIERWSEQNIIDSENQNSFLIGYRVELPNTENQVFSESVSLDELSNSNRAYYVHGNGNLKLLSLQLKGQISIMVRNVGQGNWNEIKQNDSVKIVFDAGAPTNASNISVLGIIGSKAIEYSKDRPGLILSHWDKDHYHSLLGMSNAELGGFSFFICRNFIPNLTSRKLFERIKKALGLNNIIAIAAGNKVTRGGPTCLKPLTAINNQIVIYNGQRNKNRNLSGLVLTIKTGKASAILSGDCYYEQISRDILPHLNYTCDHYLIVPHHGGNAGNYLYNSNKRNKLKEAIISVGNNPYKPPHPYQNNIKNLVISGFKIIRMDRIIGDYGFKL
ncbi:MAG: hypothetical protein PSX81_09685 [bacterium]|nr:hypothetical protein [bacterium]